MFLKHRGGENRGMQMKELMRRGRRRCDVVNVQIVLKRRKWEGREDIKR